jgi:hypothetical protein
MKAITGGMMDRNTLTDCAIAAFTIILLLPCSPPCGHHADGAADITYSAGPVW